MTEYGNGILAAAQQLCDHLKFSLKPSTVVWRDRLIIERVDSDDCVFARNVVFLPKRMLGKLDPQSWIPIMASSLIYRKRLVWTWPTDLLLAVLVTPILLIFGGAAVVKLFGPSSIAIILYILLVVVPFVANRVSHGRKKLRLRADTDASVIAGKEMFRSVLERIDGLKMADIESIKKRGISRYFSSKPTITERIQNLS